MQQRAENLLSSAEAFSVETPKDVEIASQIVSNIDEDIREAEALFGPLTKALYASHKESLRIAGIVINPLKQAKEIFRGKVADCNTRLREEERRLLWAAQAEEQEEILRLAVALEEGGEAKVAEMILEEAPPVVPIAPVELPKAEGVSSIPCFVYEIVNADKIADEFLIKSPDTKKIQRVVDALGLGAVEVVGGITVRETEKVRFGLGRRTTAR